MNQLFLPLFYDKQYSSRPTFKYMHLKKMAIHVEILGQEISEYVLQSVYGFSYRHKFLTIINVKYVRYILLLKYALDHCLSDVLQSLVLGFCFHFQFLISPRFLRTNYESCTVLAPGSAKRNKTKFALRNLQFGQGLQKRKEKSYAYSDRNLNTKGGRKIISHYINVWGEREGHTERAVSQKIKRQIQRISRGCVCLQNAMPESMM